MRKRIRLILIFALCCLAACLTFSAKKAEAVSATHASIIWSESAHSSETTTKRAAGALRSYFIVTDTGNHIRLLVTNSYGEAPLEVKAISVARVDSDGEIIKGSVTPLTFDGKEGITLRAGGETYTDYGYFKYQYGDKIAYTIVLGEGFTTTTLCGGSEDILYLEGEDADKLMKTASADYGIYSAAIRFSDCPFVRKAQTYVTEPKNVFILFGDSITTLRWKNYLIKRYQKDGRPNCVIISRAIAGNRLLVNGNKAAYGTSGFSRYKSILAEFGTEDYNIQGIFIMIGTNDIGMTTTGELTSDDLTKVYAQMVKLGHAKGAPVYFATILPRLGSSLYNDVREDVRQEVNEWLRKENPGDGLYDVDVLLRNPKRTNALNAIFDSGDGLHQNLLGDQEIANFFPIKWFRSNPRIKTVTLAERVLMRWVRFM